KLIDRLMSTDLLGEEGAASELVVASLQRLLLARVETEHVSTFDQDEWTLAIGPPRQVGIVGPHLLRQRKVAGGCRGPFLPLSLGSAPPRHRSPPLGSWTRPASDRSQTTCTGPRWIHCATCRWSCRGH